MNKLNFAQLVDIEQVQRMLEAHYKITGVLSAILDTDEKILVAAGWQDICTRFHRFHPGACERCKESDAYIKTHLPDFKGEYLDYKCRNGLWDVAVPIVIAGEHVATFFTGQFFYDDDKPDVEYFRAQAREFGFDEQSYLEALGRVPIFTRERIRSIMDFYRNLVQILVETGLKNLELTQEVREHQKTEEALRKSEERYALAVQGSNDGIWDLNMATGEAYHSSRWKSILGFEEDEISDNFKEWEKRVHPDDYERVMEVGKAYEEGRIPSFEVEYRIRHKDGGYRWVLTRGACLRDSQGKPYRMAGSLTDITSRKVMEEGRRRNEALLKAVLETLPVGVWILKKYGGMALSNEAARKIWAGTELVDIGRYREYKGWWHDSGKRIEEDEWGGARAINKGEASLGEIVDIECFDGSRKTIVYSAVPLKNDKGEIFAAVIVNEDITELKRTEKWLMESEKKYRALFEESKDFIFISDAVGNLVDVNQACVELFGYSKEEFLSMDPVRLYCNPEDRKLLWQRLHNSGSVTDCELEMKKKNDEKIIVHLSVSFIRDDEGKIFGHRGIGRDVTERKKLERQLLQAQKMESIGILAGGVAHDFNNLLTAISGYGQIIQDSIPPDDELLQESIEQVLKAADRASELTRSLLAFSRKQVINPKPVHIDTLISHTGKLIRRIIGEDIEFRTVFSDKKLLVMADAGQIEQVMMNLATNARDAMPNGGSLSITTGQVVVEEGSEALYDLPAPGNYALISVVDSGTGIDRQSIDRLFEPFFTTKEVGKGTGLGLSIVHGIIKQHDGSVLVSSERGKGTTFEIFLPLMEGRAVADQPKIYPPLYGGTETLLVVEDEEVVKLLLKKTLERAGYKVITADDGEDAVAKFKEHGDGINLVLSDVVMPKMNGKEILEEIRKMKPGMKFVFISGYTADIIHGKGILDKDVDFMTKPFQKGDLLHKVREVLDRR